MKILHSDASIIGARARAAFS